MFSNYASLADFEEKVAKLLGNAKHQAVIKAAWQFAERLAGRIIGSASDEIEYTAGGLNAAIGRKRCD